MVCNNCKQPNEVSSQFCQNCGQELILACVGCGNQVPAGSKFCGQCGIAVTAKAAPGVATTHQSIPEMPTSLASKLRGLKTTTSGERREITAVYIRVAGLDEGATEVGYHIYNEIIQQLSKIIYTYEGHIESSSPGKFLAIFGAPLAHENDPERAMRAALDILETNRDLQHKIWEKYHQSLALHIGVETGQVILAGQGLSPNIHISVVGETLKSAWRFAAKAKSGQIIVGPETYKRTRELVYYQAGAESSESTGVAQDGYGALHLNRLSGQTRGISGLRVPMVGREDTLKQLSQQIAAIKHKNQVGVTLLWGAAGVGKSRLLLELRNLLAIELPEVQFYAGSCEAHTRKRPYSAIASLLRDTIQVSESDTPVEQLQAIERYIAGLSLDPEAVEPFVLHLLGLSDILPELNMQLKRYDPDMLQNLTFTAIRLLFLAETALSPTVLIIEDLHWIDSISWKLLCHLNETINERRLLFLFASRESISCRGDSTTNAAWHSDCYRSIQLDALSLAESKLLLDQLINAEGESADHVKQLIIQRTAGNPFYIEELVRMLFAKGGIQRSSQGSEISPDASRLVATVPATLVGLILARVDLLDMEVKKFLQTISILEHGFDAELVKTIADVDLSQAQQFLQILIEREFLVYQKSMIATGYTFAHHLVRDTIYETLLMRDRRGLHLLVGETIEAKSDILSADFIELLIYHFFRSAEPVRAVPYLLEGARGASRRYAHETAVEQYQKLLGLAEKESQVDDIVIMSAKVGMGEALKYLGRIDEARELLEKSLEPWLATAEPLNDPNISEQIIGGLRELADVEQREGHYQVAINWLKTGLERAEFSTSNRRQELRRSLIERLVFVQFRLGSLDEASELALATTSNINPDKVPDPAIVATIFSHLGGIAWQQGRLENAITHVLKSLQIHRKLGYTRGIANALSNLGVLDAQRARWLSAVDYWEQARELREKMGDNQMLVISLANLGHMRMSLGQFEQAQQAAAQGLDIANRLGDKFMAARLHTIQARIEQRQGCLGAALKSAQAAHEMAQSLNSVDVEVEAGWVLAHILGLNNQLETAIATVEQTLDRAREAGLMEGETECQRVRGILLTKAGLYVNAESVLREANEYFRQMGNPYSEGRALLALGKLYLAIVLSGEPDRVKLARSSLEDAVLRFETVGAAYDLTQARNSLAALNKLTIQSEKLANPGETLADVSSASVGRHFDPAILWLNIQLEDDVDEEVRFFALMELLPSYATIAQEYGGQVRFRPDGLTVVFGAPVAGEADAEQAVEAANHIRDFVNDAEQGARSIFVKMGISQGPVVAGHIEGVNNDDLTVIGAPVVEAEKIASLALPGQVWVSRVVTDSVARLFTFEPLPNKGDHPNQLWQLDSKRMDPAPARGFRGVETPLIGREVPLAAMQKQFQNLLVGQGSIIWLEGEAGIGKSRIMREYSAHVEANSCIIWFAGCTAQRSKSPFGLFTDLFGRLIGQRHTDSTEIIREKIRETVSSWPRDAKNMQPYLALLAGIQPEGVEGKRLLLLEPEQLRRQIFVAIRRLLKVLAHQRPLLLMLDDLHWIDPMSAELLLFVATIVTSEPLMIICAQRREGSDAPNDRLVRLQGLLSQQTVAIMLNRLDPAESEHLLHGLLSSDKLPDGLAHQIVQLSEGNPYFIEEFVQLLIEQGQLQQTDTGWQLQPTRAGTVNNLPSSLESLIRSRFDSLPDELRVVLQYCAVIGREFKLELLAQVLDRPDTHLLLNRLSARLIFRYDTIAEHWQFNHALFQTVVYNSLLNTTRKQLHRLVGAALENYWADSAIDYAEELAHHYTKSGEQEKALPYLIVAGERAANQDANEEALIHFQEASRILAKQKDVNPKDQWRIAVGLGDVYRFVGNYIESSAVLKSGLPLDQTGRLFNLNQAGIYRRLGETSQKKGDFEIAVDYFKKSQTLLDGELNSEQQLEAARNLIGLAWVFFAQGRYEEAHQACEESLVYAGPANGLNELASIENLLGGIYFQQTEWRLALQHTTRAMVLREQMGYSWGVAATLGNLGILNFIVGHWDKAHSFFLRSLNMRQEMGDVEGIAITHNNLGIVYREQGNFEQAQQEFQNSFEISQTFSMAFHIANAAAGLAQVFLLMGNFESASEALEIGQIQAEEIGAKESLTELSRVKAELLLAEDDLAGAHLAAQEAAILAIDIGNRSHEAASWRISAETARRQGQLETALAHLDHARGLIAQTTDELESGRLALQAGLILRDMLLSVEALDELQLARQIFTRLGAQYYLQLLDTLKVAQ